MICVAGWLLYLISIYSFFFDISVPTSRRTIVLVLVCILLPTMWIIVSQYVNENPKIKMRTPIEPTASSSKYPGAKPTAKQNLRRHKHHNKQEETNQNQHWHYKQVNNEPETTNQTWIHLSVLSAVVSHEPVSCLEWWQPLELPDRWQSAVRLGRRSVCFQSQKNVL